MPISASISPSSTTLVPYRPLASLGPVGSPPSARHRRDLDPRPRPVQLARRRRAGAPRALDCRHRDRRNQRELVGTRRLRGPGRATAHGRDARSRTQGHVSPRAVFTTRACGPTPTTSCIWSGSTETSGAGTPCWSCPTPTGARARCSSRLRRSCPSKSLTARDEPGRCPCGRRCPRGASRPTPSATRCGGTSIACCCWPTRARSTACGPPASTAWHCTTTTCGRPRGRRWRARARISTWPSPSTSTRALTASSRGLSIPTAATRRCSSSPRHRWTGATCAAASAHG